MMMQINQEDNVSIEKQFAEKPLKCHKNKI